jgi:hypothetical protein
MGFEPGRIRLNVVLSLCINISNEIEQYCDSTGFNVLRSSSRSSDWAQSSSNIIRLDLMWFDSNLKSLSFFLPYRHTSSLDTVRPAQMDFWLGLSACQDFRIRNLFPQSAPGLGETERQQPIDIYGERHTAINGALIRICTVRLPRKLVAGSCHNKDRRLCLLADFSNSVVRNLA